MKKKLLGLLTLMMTGMSAMAGNKPIITVADVEATPGETVSFAVTLADGKADTYTAMTLYAQFPTEGFSTTGAFTVADAWTGATGVVGDVNTTTGLATIPFASANAITGAYVTNLVTVSFKVDESVAVGSYDVTLKQTLFEYNTSDKDYADDVTFKVKVVARHTVTLDETSTTAPAAAEDVNVRVLRTIKADEWSTIVLPFAMTEAQCKAAFGSDVQIGDFTGYDTIVDEEENIVGITVSFEDANAIETNHPYIIKVSQAVSEFTVDGVDIDPEDVPCVALGTTTGKGKNAVYHPMDFTGTYVADFDFYNDAQSRALFLSGNKFYYASENTMHMKAYRAYFDFDDVLTEVDDASASRISMTFGGEVTGISSMHHSQCTMHHDIYSLSGQRVESPAKGIYVIEGKKVIIK